MFTENNGWQKARLMNNSGYRHYKKGSYYWNFCDMDGENARGAYLYPNQLWGVLRGDDVRVDVNSTTFFTPDGSTSAVNDVPNPAHADLPEPTLAPAPIPQVEGEAGTPDSMTPDSTMSLETSPPAAGQAASAVCPPCVSEKLQALQRTELRERTTVLLNSSPPVWWSSRPITRHTPFPPAPIIPGRGAWQLLASGKNVYHTPAQLEALKSAEANNLKPKPNL